MIQSAKTEKTAPKPAKELTLAARRHRDIGWYGCLLGIFIGASGLLLGRLGQLWIAFDLFAQFTPQFVFLTVAFFLGLLLPRGKVLLACLMFFAMVAAYGAWPFWAGAQARPQLQPAEGMRSLKVASFNTWMPNQTPDAVIAEVARLDADVVTLMEFGPNKVKLLQGLRGQYPYQAECTKLPDCNLAILSKSPIVDTQMNVNWQGPPLMRVVLGGDLAGLNVVAVHTTRFPYMRAQLKQAQALARLIESLPGPKLVMGDFNATPFSRIIHILQNDADLQRWTNLPSWPSWAGLPQLAIDHVFTSSGISLSSGEQLGNPSGSDHFPVTMILIVPLAVLNK